jgi:hypothetical protein
LWICAIAGSWLEEFEVGNSSVQSSAIAQIHKLRFRITHAQFTVNVTGPPVAVDPDNDAEAVTEYEPFFVGLYDHVATPDAFVVTVCVVVPPGRLMVNVTAAPAAGTPLPLVITAWIVTFARTATVAGVTDNWETYIGVGGVITVQLAFPVAVCSESVAVALTGQVPGVKAAGTFFVMVTVPDCAGFKVNVGAENDVDHPSRLLELSVNVLAAQPVESLLVTVTV